MHGRDVPEDDPLVGQVIDGRYRVTSRLGAGGMGFVYLAQHVQLGRELVIKRLRPELVDNESTGERFMREAQASSRIQHPHVIAVSDFGVLPDVGAYYVMELLKGSDLGAELMRVGRMEMTRAFGIMEQAAEALAAAHSVSIVHRDLKPENVFLTTRDGHPDFVKVLDFGLARVMDANRKLTETGQVIGTPRYMAPEQCRGEKVDARADVYSLALIFYEMLTGQQPYQGLSTYEILGKKMFDHIARPSTLSPAVMLPGPLEAFLMRCLEREAPLRPSHGAAMADELHQVRLALGISANRYAHLAEGARQSMPRIAEPPVSSLASSLPTPLGESAPEPSPSSPPAGAPAFLQVESVAVAAPVKAASAWPLMVGLSGVGLLLLLGAGGGALYWWSANEPAPTDSAPATVPTPVAIPANEAPAAPRTAMVEVVTEPHGAELLYDGVLIGMTPLSIDVPGAIPSGSHVELRLQGYAPRQIALISGVPTAHVTLHPVEGIDETPE